MNRQESTWLGQIRERGDGIANGRLLVACSGGGDSVALLHFLWAVRRSLDLDLIVAHADHGLRADAEADAAHVASLCRAMDLDLVETRLNVRAHARTTRQGLETAARELRWAWLRAEAEACGALAVATGHTLDDHTETVLLRLERGGGLGALTPLPPHQGLRWSPLVQVRRQDLRRYLQRKGITWREDPSNLEPFTARNRWRTLLAQVRAQAPLLDAHLWETHCQVAELRAWADAQVEAWHGPRWEVLPEIPAVRVRGGWSSPELRWTLDAAFRLLGWAREASHLRDLEAWVLDRMPLRRRRIHTWGAWRLEPEAEAWRLTPEP